jgi:hypothetical protein
MHESLETDTLARLVEEKLGCLTQLAELGRRQSQLIESEEMNDLLQLLVLKQRLLQGLGRIETQLDPFRSQDPSARQWRCEEDRRLCAGKIDRCERLLRKIVHQEKQSEEDLAQRRDKLATRIDTAQSAPHVHGAYLQSSSPTASRIDLSSEV